jgi:hypothetical protein
MQQGLDYVTTLDIPFVFSSNGDGFLLHDRTSASAEREVNLTLDAFPSPADLWERYRAWKGLTPEAEIVVLQDYYDDGSGKAPRYYQVNINSGDTDTHREDLSMVNRREHRHGKGDNGDHLPKRMSCHTINRERGCDNSCCAYRPEQRPKGQPA